MTEEKVKLAVGSLLHDVGKVIYRDGSDRRDHSISGYDYLSTEADICDKDILDCVRYHHASSLENGNLQSDHPAYIVCMADNIAASADRREREESEDNGFELSGPLQSVFNILNGNHEELYYYPKALGTDKEINYPSAEKKGFSEEFYKSLKEQLTDNLKGRKGGWNEECINLLLAVMETNLSFMPFTAAKNELADISLYDHVKLTAAFACCIYDYLNENKLDYKETLFANEENFYKEEAFMLCSLDISGIQKFIYTITSKGALKMLRARSFYLEILMEHIIDLLLERLELSRANLLYSGGGHCYLLLPGTEKASMLLRQFCEEMAEWFLEHYRTELYMSCGYVKCSANTLRNIPEGSYSELFQKTGAIVSKNKQSRYTAEQIVALNRREEEDYSRECKVCKAIRQIDAEGVCPLCRSIEALSKAVLYAGFFTILSSEAKEALPLPGGYGLVADTEESLKQRMEKDSHYVRSYAKNQIYTGRHVATKLWVGDYSTGDTFEEFAKQAEGIDRIGILRADVDNLGQAFVFGFENPKYGSKHVSLPRVAAFSRQLSLFFKYLIRSVLEKGEYDLDGNSGVKKRKAAVIYSGGDDVFIAGAWNEVIELAIDLGRKFARYTQGTLSISAGIGIYDAKYPVIAIAEECGGLEDESKRMPGKNAVTLLPDGRTHEETCGDGEERNVRISDGTYTWEEFEQKVIGEKYRTLQKFLKSSEDRGMAFVYRILELLRGQEDKINFVRIVYALSRLEPAEEGPKKEHYQEFSKKMYAWIQNEADCRQLRTAINLYAYMHRKGEEHQDED